MNIGIPIIISAPSGAGKTSLVKALLDEGIDLKLSISHTTRAKRPGEVHGENYYFIAHDEFESLIKQNAFLEYAKVFDHYYGTSKEFVNRALAAGQDVIFEIDWQGARDIRKVLDNCVSIFILPPSLDVLAQRLRSRGQDNEEIIGKRMREAKAEISHYDEFDYLVVNDDFTLALRDLQAIIQCQRLQRQSHSQELRNLLANLLA